MRLFSLSVLALLLMGCPIGGGNAPTIKDPDGWHREFMKTDEKEGVEEITVQHILVGMTNARTKATRSKAEARALADELFKRAKEGEDFTALVREYTDDGLPQNPRPSAPPPGTYTMTMNPAAVSAKVSARKGMVPAFGDVGWRLEVGEIGMSLFHAKSSPYGYHIIKRIK